MGLIKEDWERVYLNDIMYLKEKEWEEQEFFDSMNQSPAKIKVNVEKSPLPKKIKQNE